MIIECINCNKKFDIDAVLIPSEGRLLKCSSCSHEWFFKKKVVTEASEPLKIKKIKSSSSTELEQNIQLNIDNDTEIDDNTNKSDLPNIEETTYEENKAKGSYNILSLIIVFIISFIAIIILIDTFKTPLGKIVPNIEFLLYNFYESIKDAVLFFKDLI
jgi:predicted Zn finger-like uncharacterized protein